MSDEQDKNVQKLTSESAKASRRRPRRKMSFISDGYTASEVLGIGDVKFPSWEAELGRRLEVAVDDLGKDNSVHLLGRSWKQIQRYFEGEPVAASTVSCLATATGTSVDYLIDGNIITAKDAEYERRIDSRKLDIVRREMNTADGDFLKRLHDTEILILSHSMELAKIMVILIDRPRYLSKASEYNDPSTAYNGNIDPNVLREMRESLDIPYIDTGANIVTRAPLEDDIFGELFDELSKLYENRGIRITPRDFGSLVSEKAKEIAASQADPALRRAMIPLIITQLDKELRAGKGKTDTGKRSA